VDVREGTKTLFEDFEESWPLNIVHNTLPQVFARMGLLPQ
jgi:hypothetical protein